MQILYDYALQFVGIPYKYGGKCPQDGLDCSGLIKWLLLAGGLRFAGLPNAQMLFDFYKDPKNHHAQEPELGALVFYGPSKSQINHVAMMLTKRVHIEAAGGDPTTLKMEDSIQKRAFIRVSPLRSEGLIGIFSPDYPDYQFR